MPFNSFPRLVERCISQTCEAQWRPPADVYRTRSGWAIKFDLAGVRPEDVSIQLHDCSVTVKGFRRDWIVDDLSGHYLMEISYNEFERTIELPCPDLSKARFDMEFRDGILLVRLTTHR